MAKLMKLVSNPIFDNFTSLTSAEFSARFMGFFSVLYLARVIGPEGFGMVNFSISFVLYFVLILNKGIEPFGIREIAKKEKCDSKLPGDILLLRLILSLIAFALLWVISCWYFKPGLEFTIILLFGLEIFVFAFSLEWVIHGLQIMRWSAVAKTCRAVIYLASILIFVSKSEDIFLVPIFRFVCGMVEILIVWVVVWRAVETFEFSVSIGRWKKIYVASLPMMFSFFMTEIYHSFDQIMIGFLDGNKAVGIYSAAYKFVPLATMIPVLYGKALFPMFARLHNQKDKKLTAFADDYLKIMFLFTVVCSFSIFFWSEFLIQKLFGTEYNESINILKLLSFVMLFAALSYTYGHQLLAFEKQNTHMKITFAGAIINLVLNFIFIPKFSYWGAAVATIVAEFAVFYLFKMSFEKIVKGPNYLCYLIKPILIISLSGVPSFCIVRYLPFNNPYCQVGIYCIILAMFTLCLYKCEFKKVICGAI